MIPFVTHRMIEWWLMAYIVACLMASLSFILNRLLLKYLGKVTIITASPIIEEAAKTLLSYYLSADILATHIVFGILEAGYDWHNTEHKAKAAAFSIIGHSAFGLLSVAGIFLSANVWVGLACGITFHLIWNYTVIRVYSGG